MDPLASIEDWPVATAAAGVTAADHELARHGPVDGAHLLASVTKPLTAYAVLVAVQDGLVHLDEPMTEQGATVRHLLAHASGLPPEEGGGAKEPEQRRIYSNHGYELLGALVEERAGRPFAEHLRLEVLEPLRMGATSLEGSPAWAATGTVTDLLAFGRELLQPTLVAPELVVEACSVAFPGLDGVLPGFGPQRPNDWGLGFEIRGDKSPHWTGSRNSPRTFGHFGQTGSFLWVDPAPRLACAAVTDGAFGPWAAEAWPQLSDAVLDRYA